MKLKPIRFEAREDVECGYAVCSIGSCAALWSCGCWVLLELLFPGNTVGTKNVSLPAHKYCQYFSPLTSHLSTRVSVQRVVEPVSVCLYIFSNSGSVLWCFYEFWSLCYCWKCFICFLWSRENVLVWTHQKRNAYLCFWPGGSCTPFIEPRRLISNVSLSQWQMFDLRIWSERKEKKYSCTHKWWH